MTEIESIPYGFCQCGCGQKTKLVTQTHSKYGWTKGEPLKFIKYHHARLLTKNNHEKKTYPCFREKINNSRKNTRLHIFVAEKALGKKLPPKAIVHHIDSDFTNYENSNLVVCQDDAYHRLIHVRTEAFNQCRNANYKKCSFCKKWDDPNNMTKLSTRATHYHKHCNNNAAKQLRRQ